MGLKDIHSMKLSVFELDNTTFNLIGEVNNFTSAQWTKRYNSYGEFELNAPMTNENKELLRIGHVLWLGEADAMIITIVNYDLSSEGERTITVKGRSLEFLLDKRCVWERTTFNNQYVSTIMIALVNKAMVAPTDTKRIMPYIGLEADPGLGGRISKQKTGGSLYEGVQEIAESAGLGFRMNFNPEEQTITFEVYEGKDRTISQTTNLVVEFSTEVEDLLSSAYYKNTQDYKNVAWVWGEGEGTARKRLEYGETTLTGFERDELYVDAKDIQSEESEEGTATTTEEEYYELLKQRAKEKFEEQAVEETFEASLRMFGELHNKLDEDYFLGDVVTITDRISGVQINARITAITYNLSNDFSTELTFGYGYPTLLEAVKRML